MTAIKFTHGSLRFDVPVATTVGYLVDLLADQRPDIFTATECTKQAVVTDLRKRVGRRYAMVRVNEYLFVWDKDAPVSPIWKSYLYLASGLYMIFGKWTRRLRIGTKNFRINGRRLRVDVFHGPSGIQDGDAWRTDAKPGRIRATKTGFAKFGRRIRALELNDPDAIQVQVGDPNLDQKRPVWLTWLTATLGVPSIWQFRMPDRGTHGDRLIDTAHVHGAEVTGAWVVTSVNRPPGIDHRPISFTIEVPKVRA